MLSQNGLMGCRWQVRINSELGIVYHTTIVLPKLQLLAAVERNEGSRRGIAAIQEPFNEQFS